MAEKSSFGTRQTDDKNLVWFGEIERKLALIVNTYLFLSFFLLIILWLPDYGLSSRLFVLCYRVENLKNAY
jgi:hypothetical protein